MRSKELAHDYRYFPEPDLVPVVIPPALLEELRAKLPELPLARRSRFVSEYGLPAYDAGVLTSERELADYFEEMVKAGAEAKADSDRVVYQMVAPGMLAPSAEVKAASNWVMVEVLRELTERAMDIADFPVPAEDTADLLSLLRHGRVTRRIARRLFSTMIDRWLALTREAEEVPTTTTPPPETTTAPSEILEEEGLEQISDTGELERAVARVIAENPKPVADYRAGRKQAFAYLVGQLMRVTKGKANPQLASQLLEQALAGER
jgi:aspartyl-tRNA(Asn)/glutamyl-tRNA(Gln) amidotransferase subunit B